MGWLLQRAGSPSVNDGGDATAVSPLSFMTIPTKNKNYFLKLVLVCSEEL